MTEKLRRKWIELYDVAQQIGEMEPWAVFKEKDWFSYVWEDKSKTVHFSFIAESAQKYGIACYVGEENYFHARARLTSKNDKCEPVFMLQNALMCLWDNRNDLSKKSYLLIKELGFNFRGKGAWLHFERYEIGYLPVLLNEKEVELLTEAFKNLYMMLRAVIEQSVSPGFGEGKTLVRWYEPKDKLYYTHSFDLKIPQNNSLHSVVTVAENDWIGAVRIMKCSNYSVELDWSYLDVIYKDEDDRGTFPRMILAVNSKTGSILVNELLSPLHNKPGVVFNVLGYLIENNGKPSELSICDEELKGILGDVCKKVGIKLTFKKNLSKVSIARSVILSKLR